MKKDTGKRYSSDEIHIGMEVNERELSEIYDKKILLKQSEIKDGQLSGIIAFIGDELNSESDEVFLKENGTFLVNNNITDRNVDNISHVLSGYKL